jgi:hypothetical protein
MEQEIDTTALGENKTLKRYIQKPVDIYELGLILRNGKYDYEVKY